MSNIEYWPRELGHILKLCIDYSNKRKGTNMFTYEDYQKRVLARASHRWYNDQIDMQDLKEVLEGFIEYGNRLDRVKKALMYGRNYNDIQVDNPVPIVDEADQRIIHACLGVATEGVEMMEAVEAYFFGTGAGAGTRAFDWTNLQEEFGDAEWYRAFFLATVQQTDEGNRLQNDAKLEARFGATFTEEAANNRDLENERRILEGNGDGDSSDAS